MASQADRIILIVLLAAQLCPAVRESLPGLVKFHDVVCFGDSTSYLANCTKQAPHNTDAVIAVFDIMAGVNENSSNCPDAYLKTADPSCCTINETDCTFSIGDAPFTRWFKSCTGKSSCSTPGAQQISTIDKCEDKGGNYGSYSHYMYMDYYCVESSKLHSICKQVSTNHTGKLQFLVSDGYPSTISAGDLDCKCSVEVDDCDAKIQIYTIHLELHNASGACLLTFTDGDTIEEFTCNNISQGISMRETKSTYITLQLFNMENNSGGRFWIGFGATINSAMVSINCPAKEQMSTCVASTKSTSTVASPSTTSTVTSISTRPSTTSFTSTISAPASASTTISTPSTTSAETSTSKMSTSASTTTSTRSTPSTISTDTSASTMSTSAFTSTTSTISTPSSTSTEISTSIMSTSASTSTTSTISTPSTTSAETSTFTMSTSASTYSTSTIPAASTTSIANTTTTLLATEFTASTLSVASNNTPSLEAITPTTSKLVTASMAYNTTVSQATNTTAVISDVTRSSTFNVTLPETKEDELTAINTSNTQEHAVVALTAGICVLVFIVLVLAVVTVFYCNRLRRRIKKIDDELADLKQKSSSNNIVNDDVIFSGSHLPTLSSNKFSPNNEKQSQDKCQLCVNEDANLKLVQTEESKSTDKDNGTLPLLNTMAPVKTVAVCETKQDIKQKKQLNARDEKKLNMLLKPNKKVQSNWAKNNLKRRASLSKEQRKFLESSIVRRLHFSNQNGNKGNKVSGFAKRAPKIPKTKSSRRKLKTSPSLQMKSGTEVASMRTMTPSHLSALATYLNYNNEKLATKGVHDNDNIANKAQSDTVSRQDNVNDLQMDKMESTCDVRKTLCIKEDETTTTAHQNRPKRKRYLKVYRILSSSLGYSWTYIEVPKRKKKTKANKCQATAGDEKIKLAFAYDGNTKSANKRDHPLNEDQVFKRVEDPSFGQHGGREQIKDRKPTEKPTMRNKRKLGSKRIVPLCGESHTDNTRMTRTKVVKPSNVGKLKKRHWTDSAF